MSDLNIFKTLENYTLIIAYNIYMLSIYIFRIRS